jgi:hypothetical protein
MRKTVLASIMKGKNSLRFLSMKFRFLAASANWPSDPKGEVKAWLKRGRCVEEKGYLTTINVLKKAGISIDTILAQIKKQAELGLKNEKVQVSAGETIVGLLQKLILLEEDLKAKKAPSAEDAEDTEYYLLGYWSNAYSRREDKEYFWMGPFDERKDAVLASKRKQENGQPKTFKDWCGGGGKIFSSWEAFEKAAKTAGLNPRKRE